MKVTQSKFLKSSAIVAVAAALSACSSSNSPPPSSIPNQNDINVADKPVMGLVSGSAANGAPVSDNVNNIKYDADAGAAEINRATNDVSMTGATSAGNNIVKLEDSTGLKSALIIAQTTDGNGYAAAYRDGDNAVSNPEHSVLVGGASTTAAPLVGATYQGDYVGYASQHALGLSTKGVTTGDVSLTITSPTTATGGITSRNTGLANVTFGPLTVTGADFTGTASTTGIFGQAASGTVSGTFFETDNQNPTADEAVGTLLLQGGTCVVTGVNNGTCAIESGAFHAAN